MSEKAADDIPLNGQVTVDMGSGKQPFFSSSNSLRQATPSCDSQVTLGDQAYELIRQQILHGDLEPGAIVSERMLATRVQLGKAPVRTAVQRLASEGLLTVEPRRGVIVSSQSIQDILDLYEIRAVLEQLVARRIAGKLQPEQIDRLQAHLKQHREIAEKGEPTRTLASDLEFHRLLYAFHENRHLVVILNRILDSLFPELLLSHKKSPERVLEAVGEHEVLADAIIRGDAAEAEELMAKHLGSCQQFIMSRGGA